MKPLLVLGAVAVAGLNSPWIAEGTSNNCAALERLAIRAIAKKEGKPPPLLAQGFIALSDGRMAALAVSNKLPNVPTPISCAFTYWDGFGDGMLQ